MPFMSKTVRGVIEWGGCWWNKTWHFLRDLIFYLWWGCISTSHLCVFQLHSASANHKYCLAFEREWPIFSHVGCPGDCVSDDRREGEGVCVRVSQTPSLQGAVQTAPNALLIITAIRRLFVWAAWAHMDLDLRSLLRFPEERAGMCACNFWEAIMTLLLSI